jgi:hypothetical protein
MAHLMRCILSRGCALQSNIHNKACQKLISQGLAICKPCGLVCPNLGNLKEYHWPSQWHESRVSWLESSASSFL